HIVVVPATPALQLTGPDWARGVAVIIKIKRARLAALGPHVQHAIGSLALRNWFVWIRSWQESAEAQEQPQSIRLGEIARGFVPLAHELLRVFGRNQRGLQPSESIVIKTEVCGDKSLFQDGCSSEQSH